MKKLISHTIHVHVHISHSAEILYAHVFHSAETKSLDKHVRSDDNDMIHTSNKVHTFNYIRMRMLNLYIKS